MAQPSKNLDQSLAAAMFSVSAAFLILLSGALHLRSTYSDTYAIVCLIGLAMLYPIFVAEFVLRLRSGQPRWRQYLLYCLLPPLRLGARDQSSGDEIWLPRAGWSSIDRPLRDRVRRAFSGPMILIALLIVPVLACEFFWKESVDQYPLLSLLLDLGTAIIWTAFAFEFIIMLAIVNAKVRYCKEHWVDLAIICLPLLAAARLLRLQSLLRLNKLVRAARVYRLRGVLLRAYRGILILDLLYHLRLLKPEGRLKRLRQELRWKEEEIEHLRETICQLEAEVEATQLSMSEPFRERA